MNRKGICVACVAALSLFVVGCDKSKNGGGGGGEGGDKSQSGRTGEPPVEKETYLDSSFEIQCVEQELGSEVDVERIKEDVLSKYEIKQKKYKKSKEYFSTPKKKKDDEDDEDDEKEKTEEHKELAERLDEECTLAKARSFAGQAPIDKETYVDATFELSCVEDQFGDSDKVEMDEVEKRIYKRKDLDDDTYSMAEEFFSEKEKVSEAIKSRMKEDCTKGRARTFAGLEEPGPAYTGTLQGSVSGEAGFGNAKLKITVSDDYSVYGNLSGTREGKGFRVPLEGRVSKNNNLSVNGGSGQNNVKVSGKLSSGGTTANVSGNIFGRSFSLAIRVN